MKLDSLTIKYTFTQVYIELYTDSGWCECFFYIAAGFSTNFSCVQALLSQLRPQQRLQALASNKREWLEMFLRELAHIHSPLAYFSPHIPHRVYLLYIPLVHGHFVPHCMKEKEK